MNGGQVLVLLITVGCLAFVAGQDYQRSSERRLELEREVDALRRELGAVQSAQTAAGLREAA